MAGWASSTARDEDLGRVVAVKAILSGFLASADEAFRFQREASAIATLDHPGIVPIYEVGENRGFHFFTMRFLACGAGYDVVLWEVASARRIRTVRASAAGGVHVEFSRSGDLFACSSPDFRFRFWDLVGGELLRVAGCG